MEPTNAGTLVKLGDTDLMLADPAEDIRGRTVVDRDGEETGEVESLLLDEQQAKVRFLEVRSGDFLGLGGKTRLVPVDAVTQVEDDAVHVDATREHVKGSPAYDPGLVDEEEYFQSVSTYYGYPPYWAAGYAYPGFPYHR